MAVINVPRQPGVFESLLEGLMRGQQIRQQQQLMEMREQSLKQQEKRLELDQAAFEQELGKIQAQQALARSQVEANPGLMQSPALQALIGQVGNANAPEGTARAFPAAVNQAILTQGIQGAQGGQAGAMPTPGAFETAAQQTGVPTATRSAVRRQIAPTEGEQEEDAIETARRQVEIVKIGQALSLFDQIQSGEADLQSLARSDDLGALIGASELGVDQDVRQLRGSLQRRVEKREGIGQELTKFFRQQASELLDEADLEGEIPLALVARGLQNGFGALSEEEQTTLAPLREAMDRARFKAEISVASAVDNTPTQRMLSAAYQLSAESGDEERAARILQQKADLAEEMLDISQDDPNFPFPTPRIEEGGGLFGTGVGPALTQSPGIGINADQIDRQLAAFVIEDHEGSLKSAESAIRESISQAQDEDLKSDLREMLQRLVRLRQEGVERFGAP